MLKIIEQAVVDVKALEVELRAAVRGEVRFDDGSRALYSTDASNYRQVALGLVLPKDASDVEAAVAACRRHGAPIVSRGGGTSLAGETCNAAVVLDFSKYMNALVGIDWAAKTARVEPGCVTDDLRDAAETRHLTFGPDPATHNRNTLGGMIGNNSCGMHAQMAGKVEENIEELEILTYDGLRMRVGRTDEDELERIIAGGGRKGEIYAKLKALRDRYADLIRVRFPKIPRRVSGYNLNELLPENGFNVARALVGTEGTCVTVLEATCRLVDSPPCRTLVVFGFADIVAAADHVPFCNSHGPIALEGLDQSMFDYMHEKGRSTRDRAMFPDGNAWLIVEFGARTKEEADAQARRLVTDFKTTHVAPSSKIFDDREEEKRLWEVRESGLGSTSKIPREPDFYPGWEDSAVDPTRLGEYLREFQQLMERYGYRASLYGHFGQGCLHCSIDFDLFTAEGIAKYRAFVTEAAHTVVKFGGSLSGEHGDGQSRGELLPIMFGNELVEAFWEFKTIWDPQNKMNPGKVSHPNRLDENLRWGVDYEPWHPTTRFTFPEDQGSFAFAANRCVGTGKCRKHDAGTMCPSYMATKEEAYSTRGRARLLFEMLQGDPIADGWASEPVKDALEYCLSCKGCKHECPVNVDMATYKAEFLSHYYERKRRPIAAYAFGLMPWWARLGSLAPDIANFFSQAPIFRDVAKAAASIAKERTIPMLARQTFRAWFEDRSPRNLCGPDVLLWPDTWNNHFHPTTAQAAVEVLEDAGFHVLVPSVALCCGRPLYDYGMLDLAKKWLLEILDVLRPQIRAGIALVGLEPSCVSVFRDEMVNLLGDDEDAKRFKSQTFLLTEFLQQKVPHYAPPPLRRKAVIHEHCHHKSVLDRAAEQQLFDRIGLEYEAPDTGCCGMAGPFGFEERFYNVSVKIGERVLLPKVRECDEHTIVIANGFSCREQVAQLTDRQALHPAQVLKMAIDQRGAERNDALPERRYMPDLAAERRRLMRKGTRAIAAFAFAGAATVLFALRRR
ncbi:MAG TPA: FAD-binding and (Fe-S)-binding domain-containing protein [Candidatus Cybelea sp.]|jgi:FAD/FMN-containing dehydrogenase/Fe-S oxidoreductase|nr:FAD-binding and (Fe-S)-binding domain-containing protein [Candidatus Cybelea sp.]